MYIDMTVDDEHAEEKKYKSMVICMSYEIKFISSGVWIQKGFSKKPDIRHFFYGILLLGQYYLDSSTWTWTILTVLVRQ